VPLMRGRKVRTIAAYGLLLSTAMAVAVAAAQPRFRGGGRGRYEREARLATPESFDGLFNFCRVVFRSGYGGDGGGWSVDYPRADENLSIRLAEITKTRISTGPDGEPNNLLIRLTDAELFQCPFVMMTEVGALSIEDEEASQLRDYLRKGGFLWADDFWGNYAWVHWVREFSKVLPPAQYPIVDLPIDHPLFRTMFEVRSLPQIPSINHWMGSGGGTSERGIDSAEPHARAILDDHGRIMVLMTHNTDFGDAFEREGDNPQYFTRFSLDGYAAGIDFLLYAMTH
jgi:hypothetical protein